MCWGTKAAHRLRKPSHPMAAEEGMLLYLSYWHTNDKTSLICYWAQGPGQIFEGLSCNCTQGNVDITKITRNTVSSEQNIEPKWPESVAELFSNNFQKYFQMKNSYLQQFSKLDKERKQPSALVLFFPH